MSLEAIGIVSEDTSKSIHFYGILGVSFSETGGSGHWEGKASDETRLMLDSVDLMRTINPEWKKPEGSSGVILCFKQNSPEQVNELYSRITKAGFKGLKPPWDAFWGQRYSSVLDPDGNQVDIFATL